MSKRGKELLNTGPRIGKEEGAVVRAAIALVRDWYNPSIVDAYQMVKRVEALSKACARLAKRQGKRRGK